VSALTTRATAALAVAVALATSGCGASGASTAASSGIPASLLAQLRPIGRAAAFHPPARGPVVGPCQRDLGRRIGVHVELFAANRVVLIPAGIGVRPPVKLTNGRIVGGRCYGGVVTLDPTGVVLVRPGARVSLADLFRSWGEPLSPHRLASFEAPAPASVTVFVDGQRRRGAAAGVPLSRHAEIVLEVGPHVPPHRSFTFPPGI
jgi:hypothetical protein